jgi:hypothetical protein
MRPYIVHLTDELILKHRFDAIREKITDPEYFLNHVRLSIEFDEIFKMRPETLGKIIASFDPNDVMVGKQELFSNVRFDGDCEGMLRSLTAACLAYAVRARLDPDPKIQLCGIPAFHSRTV